MILRPSGAGVWIRCALYALLSFTYGGQQDDQDTTVREQGTACHYSAATGAGVGAVAPNGVVIDAEMVKAAQLWRATLAKWPVSAVVETLVHCQGIHPLLKGTPDAMGWDPHTGTLYLADLKYGFRWVPHEGNWQLLCYTDGAGNFFIGPHWKSVVKRIVHVIVQPRHYSTPDVRVWETTPADIEASLFALSMAAEAATAPNPQGTINDGCTNCEGRHQCLTLRRNALKYVDASHAATPNNLPFDAMEFELLHVRHALKVMGDYVSGLETQVAHGLRTGQRSALFEMEGGLTSLQWNDGAKQIAVALARSMGKTVEKEPDVITPTQAKAVLGEGIVNMLARRHQKAPTLRPINVDALLKRFKK